MSEAMFAVKADFYKAIAHPARLQILELLRPGELCVCEIYPALEMEQSNTSRHLSVLKKAALVQSRKEGLKVLYRVTDARVFEILDLSAEMVREIWREKAELLR